MRRHHCTITPAVVRSTARKALRQALPWRDYGQRITVNKLLDVLLLAAALASSLSAVVKRFRFGFCHETARQALAANLPDRQRLTDGLLDALYLFGGRRLRRRFWVVAIDEHRTPFYGDRSTPGVTGGQKKHGSKYAYSYATAALVHHRHRFTVGLAALTGGQRPHEIVATLLAQMQRRGLNVRGVVLDSGFDSGETLLLLQAGRLSYTVPLRRKGRSNNRRNALWLLDVGTVTRTTWKTDKTNESVSTAVVVMRRAGEKDKKVYAFGGWGDAQARSALRRSRQAKRWYRKRFGIESSYRQLNECKTRTTKKDVSYRLLLFGVALLLRQVWVWLTRQLAFSQQLRPTQWVAEFPLAQLREWLADLLKSKYKEEKEIHLGPFPLPDNLEL
jgi:Transposase DDE domain